MIEIHRLSKMLFGHLCQPPLTKAGNKCLDRLFPSGKAPTHPSKLSSNVNHL